MKRATLRMVSLVVISTAAVQAQELPPHPSAEKEHQWLHRFVGEWSTKSEANMGPGQPATNFEGSISSRMIGGFWVVNEMKSDMAGTPMVGIQTVGFDPAKKVYVGTWIDAMGTYLWHYTGTVDAAGKILTLEAEGPNFMTEGKLTKFQDIYEFKSSDEIAIYSKMLGDDGKWITFMTGTAKRTNENR